MLAHVLHIDEARQFSSMLERRFNRRRR
jgi:hypothetical protein